MPENPEDLDRIPAGAVLRLADGQFAQLFRSAYAAGPMVLFFGVEQERPLTPADFPIELICVRQNRRPPPGEEQTRE